MSARVLDLNGRPLASTSDEKARRLIATGKATLLTEEPLTICLTRAVDRPIQPAPQTAEGPIGAGRRILVHICCAPCATYTVRRLRELAFEVTGYWYNPNIHPFSEHERRRETLIRYADEISLPVRQAAGYEMVEFLRAVSGHEQFGERCRLCYQMRLEETARFAAHEGFTVFTTTLLISPYQDQQMIKTLGESAAARYGIAFLFENFRRGWAERGRLVREHALYSQRYCGCLYSEWEALDRAATTAARSKSKGHL